MAVLCGALAAALAGPVAGQQRLVVSGFVQYISGSTLQMVADDTGIRVGGSIRVDLTLVAQSDYNTLRSGDRVRVFGYVSPDRSRLIGERIDRLDAPNVYEHYTPQTP